MAQNFDLVVIGAGPGGYVAAIRGAQLGLKVACIEREHLGGICLNWGCIPTKAMLRSAEVFHMFERAKDYGLTAGNFGYDLDAVVKRSRGVAKQLSGGVSHLLRKNKVTVIQGAAKLAGAGARVTVLDGLDRPGGKAALGYPDFSSGPTVKPGSSLCTTNAEMPPRVRFSGSVTAMTV